MSDTAASAQDRYTFPLPAGLGLVLTRSWTGALCAFVRGGLVRVFFFERQQEVLGV